MKFSLTRSCTNKVLGALVALVMVWFTGCKESPYMDEPGDNSHNLPNKELPDSSFIDPVGDLDIPAGALTVTEAIEMCKNMQAGDKTADYVYVYGYISGLADNATSISQYGNASWYMKDHVTDHEVFYAYQLYAGPNKKRFTSADQLSIGNRVVIYVHLTNFGGNTWETIGQGDGYLYASTHKEPEIPTDGEGTYDNPFSLNDIFTLGAARVGAAYVRGYIVGTNNNIDQFAAENLHLEDGFKATNLVLAGKPDVTAADIASMIPVALPKGELRDAFSLTKHAEYKGKEIVVYGRLDTYMGVLGISTPVFIKLDDVEVGTRPDLEPEQPVESEEGK